MLKTIRAGTKSWLAMGLFFILIASFAIWGMGDVIRGVSSPDSVAQIGDQYISTGEYQRTFLSEVDRLQQAFDLPRDQAAEQAVRLGLWRSILDQMILLAAVDDRAESLGIAVSDQAVRDQVLEDPAFQNDLGNFDRFRLDEFLSSVGLSQAQFIHMFRKEIQRSLVVDALITGTRVPDTMSRTLFIVRNEKRTADFVILPPSEAGDIETPDETVLRRYYQDNKDDFLTPPYRSFDYLVVGPEDMADQITVSEEELRTAYEDRLFEFSVPEKREVEQVVFLDQESAQQAYANIEAGADLSAAAGRPPVDLGLVTKSDLADLGQTAADTVFTMESGAVSGPVRSDFGWHIFRVNDIQPEQTQTLDDVADDLRSEIALQQANEILYDTYLSIEDSLAGGASIGEISDNFGFELGRLENVAANGEMADGSVIEPGTPEAQALPIAFETGVDTPLQVTELESGRYVLVDVTEAKEPYVPEFDRIREQVAQAWRQEERTRRLVQRARDLAEAAETAGSLARAAAREGLELQTAERFSRNGEGAGDSLDPSVVGHLFTTPRGDIVIANTQDGGIMVAHVTQIIPGDPSAEPEEYETVQAALRDFLANELISQYRDQLLSELEWSYEPAAIRQALSFLVDTAVLDQHITG